MIKKLYSVGSCLDTETLMVYPMTKKNEPIITEGEGVGIFDCDDEWRNKLSENDIVIIFNTLNKNR